MSAGGTYSLSARITGFQEGAAQVRAFSNEFNAMTSRIAQSSGQMSTSIKNVAMSAQTIGPALQSAAGGAQRLDTSTRTLSTTFTTIGSALKTASSSLGPFNTMMKTTATESFQASGAIRQFSQSLTPLSNSLRQSAQASQTLSGALANLNNQQRGVQGGLTATNTLAARNTQGMAIYSGATDRASKSNMGMASSMRGMMIPMVGLGLAIFEAVGMWQNYEAVSAKVNTLLERQRKALEEFGAESKEYQRASQAVMEAQRGMGFVFRGTIQSISDTAIFLALIVNALGKVGDASNAVAGPIGRLRTGIATLGGAMRTHLVPMGAFTAGLVALSIVLLAINRDAFGFRTSLDNLGKAAGDTYPLIGVLGEAVRDFAEQLGIVESNGRTAGQMARQLEKDYEELWKESQRNVEEHGLFVAALKDMVNMGGPLGGLAQTILNLGGAWEDFGEAIRGLETEFFNFWDNLSQQVQGAEQWVYDTFIEPITGIPADLQGVGAGIWEAITTFPQTAAEWINTNIVTPLTNIPGQLGEIGSGIWEAITTFPQTAADWISENIVTPLTNIPNDLGEIGGQIWDAITSFPETAATWFTDNITQPIKDALSPASLGDLGQMVVDAFGNTVEAMKSWAMTNIVEPIISTFTTIGEEFAKFAADPLGYLGKALTPQPAQGATPTPITPAPVGITPAQPQTNEVGLREGESIGAAAMRQMMEWFGPGFGMGGGAQPPAGGRGTGAIPTPAGATYGGGQFQFQGLPPRTAGAPLQEFGFPKPGESALDAFLRETGFVEQKEAAGEVLSPMEELMKSAGAAAESEARRVKDLNTLWGAYLDAVPENLRAHVNIADVFGETYGEIEVTEEKLKSLGEIQKAYNNTEGDTLTKMKAAEAVYLKRKETVGGVESVMSKLIGTNLENADVIRQTADAMEDGTMIEQLRIEGIQKAQMEMQKYGTELESNNAFLIARGKLIETTAFQEAAFLKGTQDQEKALQDQKIALQETEGVISKYNEQLASGELQQVAFTRGQQEQQLALNNSKVALAEQTGQLQEYASQVASGAAQEVAFTQGVRDQQQAFLDSAVALENNRGRLEEYARQLDSGVQQAIAFAEAQQEVHEALLDSERAIGTLSGTIRAYDDLLASGAIQAAKFNEGLLTGVQSAQEWYIELGRGAAEQEGFRQGLLRLARTFQIDIPGAVDMSTEAIQEFLTMGTLAGAQQLDAMFNEIATGLFDSMVRGAEEGREGAREEWEKLPDDIRDAMPEEIESAMVIKADTAKSAEHFIQGFGIALAAGGPQAAQEFARNFIDELKDDFKNDPQGAQAALQPIIDAVQQISLDPTNMQAWQQLLGYMSQLDPHTRAMAENFARAQGINLSTLTDNILLMVDPTKSIAENAKAMADQLERAGRALGDFTVSEVGGIEQALAIQKEQEGRGTGWELPSDRAAPTEEAGGIDTSAARKALQDIQVLAAATVERVEIELQRLGPITAEQVGQMNLAFSSIQETWPVILASTIETVNTQFATIVSNIIVATGQMNEAFTQGTNLMITALQGVQNMAATTAAALPPIGAAALAASQQVNSATNTMITALQGVINMAAQTAQSFNQIATAAAQAAQGVNSATNTMITALQGVISQANAVAEAIRQIGQAASQATSEVQRLSTAIQNIPQPDTIVIPVRYEVQNSPPSGVQGPFQHGFGPAIVDHPMNMLVGESGAELVWVEPINRNRNRRSGELGPQSMDELPLLPKMRFQGGTGLDPFQFGNVLPQNQGTGFQITTQAVVFNGNQGPINIQNLGGGGAGTAGTAGGAGLGGTTGLGGVTGNTLNTPGGMAQISGPGAIACVNGQCIGGGPGGGLGGGVTDTGAAGGADFAEALANAIDPKGYLRRALEFLELPLPWFLGGELGAAPAAMTGATATAGGGNAGLGGLGGGTQTFNVPGGVGQISGNGVICINGQCFGNPEQAGFPAQPELGGMGTTPTGVGGIPVSGAPTINQTGGEIHFDNPQGETTIDSATGTIAIAGQGGAFARAGGAVAQAGNILFQDQTMQIDQVLDNLSKLIALLPVQFQGLFEEALGQLGATGGQQPDQFNGPNPVLDPLGFANQALQGIGLPGLQTAQMGGTNLAGFGNQVGFQALPGGGGAVGAGGAAGNPVGFLQNTFGSLGLPVPGFLTGGGTTTTGAPTTGTGVPTTGTGTGTGVGAGGCISLCSDSIGAITGGGGIGVTGGGGGTTGTGTTPTGTTGGTPVGGTGGGEYPGLGGNAPAGNGTNGGGVPQTSFPTTLPRSNGSITTDPQNWRVLEIEGQFFVTDSLNMDALVLETPFETEQDAQNYIDMARASQNPPQSFPDTTGAPTPTPTTPTGTPTGGAPTGGGGTFVSVSGQGAIACANGVCAQTGQPGVPAAGLGGVGLPPKIVTEHPISTASNVSKNPHDWFIIQSAGAPGTFDIIDTQGDVVALGFHTLEDAEVFLNYFQDYYDYVNGFSKKAPGLGGGLAGAAPAMASISTGGGGVFQGIPTGSTPTGGGIGAPSGYGGQFAIDTAGSGATPTPTDTTGSMDTFNGTTPTISGGGAGGAPGGGIGAGGGGVNVSVGTGFASAMAGGIGVHVGVGARFSGPRRMTDDEYSPIETPEFEGEERPFPRWRSGQDIMSEFYDTSEGLPFYESAAINRPDVTLDGGGAGAGRKGRRGRYRDIAAEIQRRIELHEAIRGEELPAWAKEMIQEIGKQFDKMALYITMVNEMDGKKLSESMNKYQLPRVGVYI